MRTSITLGLVLLTTAAAAANAATLEPPDPCLEDCVSAEEPGTEIPEPPPVCGQRIRTDVVVEYKYCDRP